MEYNVPCVKSHLRLSNMIGFGEQSKIKCMEKKKYIILKINHALNKFKLYKLKESLCHFFSKSLQDKFLFCKFKRKKIHNFSFKFD